MKRAFTTLFNETGDPCTATDIVIRKLGLLRNADVYNLTRGDKNLPGYVSLELVKQLIAALVIKNGKKAKNGKKKLAFVEDPTAEK